jgi:hypothetical protein
MHPFLPISDLQFLTGKELSQVRLDPYSLQFHFLDGTTIAVNRRIEHVDQAGQTHVHDCQIQTGAALYLHQLLQRRIAMIEVEPYRLSLTFDGGAILRVLSDDGPYECGTISPGFGETPGIIVF